MGNVHILMYHQIGVFPARPPSHRAQVCDLNRFRAHLTLLRKKGYHPISLSDAYAGLKGQQALPPKAVVLSFDDGYVDFLRQAAPILKDFSYPAIVYAVTGLLGQTSQWVAPEGLTPQPLMSAAELQEVQRLGFEIGSHTHTHLRMKKAAPTLIRQELRDSKAKLEDILGTSVPHFCYPYGSYDLAAIEAVQKAGYLTATTCVRAVARPSDDPLALPRKPVSWGDGAWRLWVKLALRNHPRKPPVRREQVSCGHD